MIDLDDLEVILARLAQDKGDEVGWANLYTALYPHVYKEVFRMTRVQRADCEDLTQGVFLRLVQFAQFQHFRNGLAFVGYVNKVVHSVVVDHIRLSSKARRLVGMLPGSDESKSRFETSIYLKRFYSSLSGDELILLKGARDGRSIKDLAKELHISYSATGIRLYRLRKKITEYLMDV